MRAKRRCRCSSTKGEPKACRLNPGVARETGSQGWRTHAHASECRSRCERASIAYHQGKPTKRTAKTAATRIATRVILLTLITSAVLESGRLGWCADLVGAVVNSHGEPVSGVTISVVNAAGAPAGEAVSDAKGAYTISNLSPGIYKLGSYNQWVMSYIGEQGLTVDWRLGPHSAPVAVARFGTAPVGNAPDSAVTTTRSPSEVSQPEMTGSKDGAGNSN